MKDLMCLHAGTSGPSTWDRFVPEFEAMGYRVHQCEPGLVEVAPRDGTDGEPTSKPMPAAALLLAGWLMR